jgi:DNA sulfur modification protein DndE
MKVFNILDFGAVAGEKIRSTQAIADTIEACAQSGGGRVLVPAGTYLTGPIQLQSHVELHLEDGATILFSRDFDDYALTLTSWEGEDAVRCYSPVWGENLHDVAITGSGVFDGQGEAWRPVKKLKRTQQEWAELVASGGVVDQERGIWWPSQAAMQGESTVHKLRERGGPIRIEDYEPIRAYLRPNLVKLSNCRNLRLEGITFRNSPAWNVHLLLCENVTVQGVNIFNPWYAQNGDGIDIESCRNVLMSHCHLDVGDDGICLKSGKNEQGRKRGKPTENVTIRNCRVLHAHGGVTVGSEMSGGVRNIHVSNCNFEGTDIGLRFKTARGRGGIVENIEISNIEMKEIGGAAISFDMYYEGKAWDEADNQIKAVAARPVDEGTPQFRQIHIRNVNCEYAQRAIEMRGLPEMPIENITLENIRIQAKEGLYLAEAKDITLRGVQVRAEKIPILNCHNVTNLTLQRVDGVLK